MAAVLEQALAADLKEGGAADGQAPAEGVGGQPDRVVHGGSGGGLPGAAGEATEGITRRCNQQCNDLRSAITVLKLGAAV